MQVMRERRRREGGGGGGHLIIQLFPGDAAKIAVACLLELSIVASRCLLGKLQIGLGRKRHELLSSPRHLQGTGRQCHAAGRECQQSRQRACQWTIVFNWVF